MAQRTAGLLVDFARNFLQPKSAGRFRNATESILSMLHFTSSSTAVSFLFGSRGVNEGDR